jgi:hypothetical protein
MSFADVVLAISVRVEVDLASSRKTDSSRGDEEEIAELHDKCC